MGRGTRVWIVWAFVGSAPMMACKDDGAVATGTDSATSGESEGETDTMSGDRATVVHSFGVYELAPLEEIQPCIQWTLDNDEAIYVNEVTLVNDGGFHHSNWFTVPENFYAGPDGFFDCDERGFTEIESAVAGTVVFAQSTQSRIDVQDLPDGVVIKIPPRHKILAGGHLLNLANAPYPTELRMALDIIHPRDVETVVAPFRLTYYDLDIPAFSEARFGSTCDFGSFYEAQTGGPLDMRVYYVTPHYHYLGNYFDLTMVGGPNDGQNIFRLEGFNADSNGKAFDPPIDLSGASGLSFQCGFDNWRDKDIGWGVGDQEMCVMLGLADSAVMMDASVGSGQIVGEQDGILINEGDCSILGLPKNEAQTMPTDAEIAAPLYVPPSDPDDAGLPSVPPCEDQPADATPDGAATLSAIRDTLFVSSCAFSSCHAGEGAVAGLDLQAADLHAELMNHSPTTSSGLPLIAPGDPEGSWLYRLVSQCEPQDAAGNVTVHMPLNSPTLVSPGLVARVRDWIAAGAPNN